MLQTKKVKKEGNWEKKIKTLQRVGFKVFNMDNEQIILYREVVE